jgi:predicted nucleotidyltransferase
LFSQKYFQLNREYPLFDEVRKIVAKTIGAAAVIAQSLKKIGGINEAYLYGSFASKQQDAASDIDLLVIGSPREKDLAQAVGRIGRQGREIKYTVLTPKEFGSRRARKDAFLENVWHNKRVSLVGPNEEAKSRTRLTGANRPFPRSSFRQLPAPLLPTDSKNLSAYCSYAYSALAGFKMGMSRSARG